MKNEEGVETKYGTLQGITNVEYYSDGGIKECTTNEKLILKTDYGNLIPQYENEGVRRRFIKTLAFYPNGILKKIALEEQTVIETSIGSLSAELIHFYENGKIKRVFPLNGKITGYWTEDNEFELAKNIKFELDFGIYELKAMNILFYKSGNIKSITFWPKEFFTINIPIGKIGVRYGLGLYESGKIRSFEPAYPVVVETPIGKITAFDMNANGVNGDINSLNLYEDGSICSLVTSTDVIIVTNVKGEEMIFKPEYSAGMLGEEELEMLPLHIQFQGDYICFHNKKENKYSIRTYKITVINNGFDLVKKCGSCENCQGCI
ncbi:hypothetical protein acsn021_32430 [Anaerocolumna cellulosilytica]|uniref:Uncharacterized protein n=1 Tax=Anaerocolumna cellulosilytica TaxID=433286 RepID=A0A6S6QYG9_9FIRM|nr:hypothetical protein [Anaerocolumna cellulosilytica]MBB5196573.1 hypothetical protein [Anaerocolumna cellulosilytica]BCJ95674.1 hypothetical protein acsn021_32430 [Anaerocolumna cellulosilytica]